MCGIAGNIGHQAQERCRSMCAAMIHRGPDAEGFYWDESIGLCLGHQRLAIVDLTESGAQPMTSHCGRYVIVYNGEIYNHKALRQETQKADSTVQYRGSSDTESLLEAIITLGLEKALGLCRGMFAFCLYDKQEKTLRFARDRAGEKPLYYGYYQGDFFFSSDLLGLRAAGMRPEIDRDALRLYVNYGYYPAPYTVFKNVYKLPQGCIMTLHHPYDRPEIHHYWDPQAVAAQGIAQPFSGSPEEAVDRLHLLLKQAVRGQMLADVPLGAFLSGGIDSSLIVSVMQELSPSPIKTFSIGFWEEKYNEAKFAKEIAQHLGTDHTELYITEEDALDVIPKIPEIYAEPFADSSQIPTYLLSKLTRAKVTVSLSGDAGDELFGGYPRYDLAARSWRAACKIPLGNLGGPLASSLSKMPFWSSRMRELLYRGGKLLQAKDGIDAYNTLMENDRMNTLVLGAAPELPSYIMRDKSIYPPFLHPKESMMYADFRMYLTDDILVKVDRAAMAVSLETRVPFLDADIITYAWSLPLDYKVRENVTKWPLRQLLHRYVPKSMYERPKMGFSIPVKGWLTGALSSWANELLAPERIAREGYLDPKQVTKLWGDFQRGKADSGTSVWSLLMFQEWLNSWNAQ